MKKEQNHFTMIGCKPGLTTLFTMLFGLFFYVTALQSCKTSRSTSDNYLNLENFILTEVGESPEFPGGDYARMKFLQDNIMYPRAAREKGFQGTVYITFVVERDGRISDVRVLRGIHPSIDKEAVRVVRMMPKWKPGKHQGKLVRVQFNMPIKFTLQN